MELASSRSPSAALVPTASNAPYLVAPLLVALALLALALLPRPVYAREPLARLTQHNGDDDARMILAFTAISLAAGTAILWILLNL